MLFLKVQKLMVLFVQKLTDIMSLITLEKGKGVLAITSSSRGGVLPKTMITAFDYGIAVLKIRFSVSKTIRCIHNTIM